MIKINDYVLATKFSDGDTCDHFAVGFVKEIHIREFDTRYMVFDGNGGNFRANGFRRVTKITEEEGARFLQEMHKFGDIRGPLSVYDHLERIREELKKETL